MSTEERNEFSQRLKKALADAEFNSESPTKLAAEFNLRAPGSAVTTHAARKWLFGDSIPRQAKLRVLAQWLGVSMEWLRFGEMNPGGSRLEPPAGISDEDAAILESLQKLGKQDRHTVHELIRSLAAKRKQN